MPHTLTRDRGVECVEGSECSFRVDAVREACRVDVAVTTLIAVPRAGAPAANPRGEFRAPGRNIPPCEHQRSSGRPSLLLHIWHGIAVAPRGLSQPREWDMQMATNPDVSRKRARKFGTPGPDLRNRPRGETPNDRSGVRATHVERELDRRISQMREANEHLVVAAVRAQTLSEEAETASHLKDEFLATVSHEIRTPLSAVLGWARILESKQLPPEGAERAIAAIARNATALAHMIDDLLDTSRILKGAVRLALRPVDLAAVAQGVLDAVRPLAASKNVHVAFDAVAGSRTVSGDADRLQQVIWNLLANAIKFTPEGGRVNVFIESATDHMEVRVVDTGCGISSDFLPHVFEIFRQAEDATTQRHTGLGLGLGIVRHLVELHGGTVHAASPGVGQGATFTARLPMAAGSAPAGQAVALVERRTESSTTSPAPRLPRLDGLRILVVDDHVDGRTLTSLMLTQAGASVKAVASAREALRVLEVERHDALVSDIDLSDEDGYALIRQIRQHEAEHGGFLPAMALTGYARADDRARALAAGFQAHAPKPVEPAALSAAIAAITRRI
jgi:signal transduction histidine kinase